MNIEHQPRRLILGIVCALMLGVVAFIVTRPLSPASTQIRIDPDGTTRLGPLPLRNTNIRDAAFTVVSRLNHGAAEVSVANSSNMSELVKTLNALQRAGVTSLRLRIEQSASSNQVSITNK